MDFKAYAQKNENLEQTPNLKDGQKINKIVKAEFKDTRYRNQKGEMQQVCIVNTDNGSFHTTAKAIVDILHTYFVDNKNTEPLENIQVSEVRSKDGRMYLTLEGI